MSERLARFISSYGSVRRWLERVEAEGSGAYNTKVSYVYWLEKFCEYAGLNPDQIVEARREDLDKPVQFEAERRRFEDKLLSFFNRLSEGREEYYRELKERATEKKNY